MVTKKLCLRYTKNDSNLFSGVQDMTNILLIGVNHNDPLGAFKVQNALQLAKEKKFAPECIAVEWSCDYAEVVIAQRGRFSALLLDRYPDITPTDLDTFMHSLAFEADAHTKIYPDLPVLWLDEGRTVNPSVIEKYAEGRIAIIDSVDKYHHFSIEQVSYEVIQRPGSHSGIFDRDDKFASIIETAVLNSHRNIACVVGELHTDFSVKGMFGQQLVQKGYKIARYLTTATFPIWETLDFMSA